VIDIRVQSSAFDEGRQLARLAELDAGAVAHLTSLVRPADGQPSLRVDHYPAMARSEIGRIVEAAQERWDLAGCIVIFRHGAMQSHDRFAFIGVAAATGGTALEACSYLAEQLGRRAPFWEVADA
jgi:molybdopterin synthase catalytic subunit